MYSFPLPKEFRDKIVQPTGEYAHANSPVSKYAVDIICPVDTPVFASCSGTVIVVWDGYTEWGLDKALANKVNVVGMEHEDGTYAEYLHLGVGKISVKVGDKITAGQKIARTGLSGYMSEPHLHFNVFRMEKDKAISIPFEFND